MSELTTAARPYAKAAFELANGAGTLDQWSEQLAALSTVVAAEDSAALLSHPRITKDQKVDMLAEIAGVSSDGGKNLLKMLGENDRFVLLPEIANIFEMMKADAEGAIEAEVTAARKLTAKQQETIAAALQKRLGREIKLVTKVDSELMGGAVIRAGDLVIDGSIQSRLKEMKMSLGR